MANGEGPEPLYRVTSQQETTDRNVAGEYVNGVRIAYRTRSGATGSVFVPYTDYTEARARALLQERAAEAEAIHNL
jgi:hypothetical protein